jgi:hypothetical protein
MNAWMGRILRSRWCALAAACALVVLLSVLASLPAAAAQPRVATHATVPAGVPQTTLPAGGDVDVDVMLAPTPVPDLRASRDSTSTLIAPAPVRTPLAITSAAAPTPPARTGVPCRDGVLLPLLS